MQAVCQMIMFGDQKFEKVLLHLNSGDHDSGADDDMALAALNMFCLDCTGEHNQSDVCPSHTAHYPRSIPNTHLCCPSMWLQHACSCWVMDRGRDNLPAQLQEVWGRGPGVTWALFCMCSGGCKVTKLHILSCLHNTLGRCRGRTLA